MKFRPDIEGLRATAIIPVVLYHANSSLVPGGYIGVDVFFVISGFLISRIILNGIETNSFSIAGFYYKRIRRIFPALIFTLALTSLGALYVLSPRALKEYGKTLLATLLFFSNIQFSHLANYFGGNAEFKPLLHTWSLAIEEQFYFIFPFVLLAAKRRASRRYALVLLACACTSFLFGAWLVYRNPEHAFYSGPTRAFELLMGSLLALNSLPAISSRATRELIAAAGFGLIVFAVVFFDKHTPFPGPAAFIPCAGAALIIYAGQSETSSVARLLSLPPVRFFGAISYSLYLLHWPIFSLAKNYYFNQMTAMQTACALVLAVLLAAFSRKYVELPFLRHAPAQQILFKRTAVITACFVAFALSLTATKGFPQRFPKKAIRYFAARKDYNRLRAKCHHTSRRTVPYSDNCIYGAKESPELIVVWADSHGAELSAALEAALKTKRPVMQITTSGCPPALDFTMRSERCVVHNRRTFEGIIADKRVRHVILTAHYAYYAGRIKRFLSGLEKAVAGLTAAGKKLIIVGPIPTFSFPVPAALGLEVARGHAPETFHVTRAKYLARNNEMIAGLNRIVAQYNVSRVAPARYFCKGEFCLPFDGHEVLYFNENHLSMHGARILANALVPMLKD